MLLGVWFFVGANVSKTPRGTEVKGGIHLPPLPHAIFLLEQPLVVRHAVLAEEESVRPPNPHTSAFQTSILDRRRLGQWEGRKEGRKRDVESGLTPSGEPARAVGSELVLDASRGIVWRSRQGRWAACCSGWNGEVKGRGRYAKTCGTIPIYQFAASSILLFGSGYCNALPFYQIAIAYLGDIRLCYVAV